MRLHFALVAIAGICGLAFAQGLPGIKSVGLEGDADGDGVPDAWSRYVSRGTGRTAVDGDTKRSGRGSLRIEIDRNSRCTVSQLVAVADSGIYTFGGWLRTELAGNGRAHLYIQWRSGDEIVRSGRPSDSVAGESDWREVAAVSRKPEGADGALVVIVVAGDNGGQAWADEVYFRRGAHPKGLLRNPGFEQGDRQPAGWAKAIYGEGYTLSRDADEAHSGTASARLAATPDPGSRACYLQTSEPFPAVAAVRLKVWYKGTGRATGILRFRPAPGFIAPDNEYGTHFFRMELPREDWAEYEFEAPVPAPAQEAGVLRVEVILYQRAEGTLWYDDVSVQLMEEWSPVWREASDPLVCPNRPQDGRNVLQNPPDFLWNPQPNAVAYTLQLSRDESFPDQSTVEVPGLHYNVYSHSEVLDRGSWYWRARYVTDGGETSEWSNTRRFFVTDEAKPFTVPRPDAMLGRIPRGHPRIYATAETLAEFRAPLEAEREDWWEGYRGMIEGYMERGVEGEPPADWVLGDREGPLTDEIIEQGRKLRSYCSGITTRMRRLAFGYLLSGEAEYADAAVAQMVEVAGWDPDGVTSYRNHDQVFRDITYKLAMCYDWCWDRMSPRQRRVVRDAVVTRASVLYRDFAEDARPIYEHPYDSHGITSYGFLGLCAIALAHESEAADEWFEFVAATYPAIFPPWGGEEGGWCQGVGYWKWSLPFAWWFFDALRSATGVDMYEKAWQRNDGWYKMYMHPPWCDRHHFGDGNHGGPGRTDQSNLAHLAEVYDNPYYQWYAKQLPGRPGGNIYSYWWYDEDMRVRPPADVPQGAYFGDIGWVAMHSDLSDPDDIMLMFKSSPFGSFNHSHADQNSFVVYGYGEPLLIDSGYYDWYGSPHDRGWTRQTKAHNCVLVGGEGQPIFDKTAAGEITAHFTSPWVDYACGDATRAYKGRLEGFKRHILYLRPDAFLICDELAAPEPSKFTWCLHAEKEMELRADSNEVIVHRGEAKCLVKFIAPQDLEFEQNNEFTPPPTRSRPNEWHTYVTTTEKAQATRFVTLIRPYRADEPDEALQTRVMPGESIAIHLRDGKLREDYLCAGPEGGELRVTRGQDNGQVVARARFCALSRRATAADDRDATDRFVGAIVDGTRMEIARDGHKRVVMKASAPITAAMRMGDRRGGRDPFVDEIHCTCGEATTITLRIAGTLDAVQVDGSNLAHEEYNLDAGTSMLTLNMAAGDHVVRINPPEHTGGPELGIRLNDRPLRMDLDSMVTTIGGRLTWGTFEAPPGPVRAQLQAPADVSVRIGQERLQSGDTLWLHEKNRLQARSRRGDAEVRIAFSRLVVDERPLRAQEVGAEISQGPGS